MLIGSSMTLLILASGWLWWKLARTRHQNVALHTEIARLRGRLRALRH